MELKMSRCLPGFGLLCVALLLCLASGAFGIQGCCQINVVEYINKYVSRKEDSAVVLTLDKDTAKAPTLYNLRKAFPHSRMKALQEALNEGNGNYRGKHIAAARRGHGGKGFSSAEWELLRGGQRSSVNWVISQKTKNSVFFFITYLRSSEGQKNENQEMERNVKELEKAFARFKKNNFVYIFTIRSGNSSGNVTSSIREAWNGSEDKDDVYHCGKKHGCRKLFGQRC